MKDGQREMLQWLDREDRDGVELWEFPHMEILAELLSSGLVSVGPSKRDERSRIRITGRGKQVLREPILSDLRS
jgi:hypothetical protein